MSRLTVRGRYSYGMCDGLEITSDGSWGGFLAGFGGDVIVRLWDWASEVLYARGYFCGYAVALFSCGRRSEGGLGMMR